MAALIAFHSEHCGILEDIATGILHAVMLHRNVYPCCPQLGSALLQIRLMAIGNADELGAAYRVISLDEHGLGQIRIAREGTKLNGRRLNDAILPHPLRYLVLLLSLIEGGALAGFCSTLLGQAAGKTRGKKQREHHGHAQAQSTNTGNSIMHHAHPSDRPEKTI
ncbi:MAG: hypothetical protein IIV56_04930 [Mailhella sp.]|nr:hypothetical protein [Mailhella sp.]